MTLSGISPVPPVPTTLPGGAGGPTTMGAVGQVYVGDEPMQGTPTQGTPTQGAPTQGTPIQYEYVSQKEPMGKPGKHEYVRQDLPEYVQQDVPRGKDKGKPVQYEYVRQDAPVGKPGQYHPGQVGQVGQTSPGDEPGQVPTSGSPAQGPQKEGWFKRNAKLVGAVAGAAVLGGVGFLTMGPVGGIGGALVGALAGSFLVGKLQDRGSGGTTSPGDDHGQLPPPPPSGQLPPQLPA